MSEDDIVVKMLGKSLVGDDAKASPRWFDQSTRLLG